MGRFSNHCNNRFRGAFKHAVNKSIKDYQKNKQYNSNETTDISQKLSTNALIAILMVTPVLILGYGNFALFFGGQNRYLFEDNFLLVLFVIFIGIVDACIIYFGTSIICKKISSKKITKVIGNIIAILLILGLICLIVYCYLPHCYLCNKLLLNNYVTCGDYILCETCDFEF